MSSGQTGKNSTLTEEKLLEVESKLFTLEGRTLSTEENIKRIEDNVDRVEHLILQNSLQEREKKLINYPALISGTVAFLGVIATAVSYLLNYVDLQISTIKTPQEVHDRNISFNRTNISTIQFMVQDRLGRLEERTTSNEKDIRDLEDKLNRN